MYISYTHIIVRQALESRLVEAEEEEDMEAKVRFGSILGTASSALVTEARMEKEDEDA
jgi:hypothetical protein